MISARRQATHTLNVRLVLFLQRFGIGGTAARQLACALGLASGSRSFGNFTSLEEEIALHQIKLGEEIIAENVQKEMDMSPIGVDGRKNMGTGMDTGWTQRGTGKQYNSDSGISIMFGQLTKLVVAFYYMSKVCAKCKLATEHGKPLCSRNHEGSSKGMEADGGLQNVMSIYDNYPAYVGTVVTDDDSSCRSILSHPYKVQREIAKEEGREFIWPTYPGGGKKPSVGLLPKHHPPITFLADVNHRLRAMFGKIFALSRKKKSDSLVTSMDAHRLKRNFTMAIFSNQGEEFPVFVCMAVNVLEHHFGIHDNCGDEWCPFNRNKDKPEKQKELFYRNKENATDKKNYKHIKPIFNTYCSEKKMRFIYHIFSTNSCENMNKVFTKYIRKDSYLCGTVVGKGRALMAVGVESLGYEKYFSRLFNSLGADFDENMEEHCKNLDVSRQKQYEYHKSQIFLTKRAIRKSERVAKEVQKEKKDRLKGKTYKKRMAAPKVSVGDGGDSKATGERKYYGMQQLISISISTLV